MHGGDLFDVLPTLDANSIDACVTDPPYGIAFMNKAWDNFSPAAAAKHRNLSKSNIAYLQANHPNKNLRGRTVGAYSTPSAIDYNRSLEGQRGFQEWTERWAREVMRVLKPGAHLLVCGAPRSFHRMTCGLEDAGFEIRDCLSWLYGQGFPKSLDVGKAIDKRGGANVYWFGQWLRGERERRGMAQKELAQHFPSKTGQRTGCVANWELGYNLPTSEQFNLLCDVLGLPFQRIEEAERNVTGQGRSGPARIAFVRPASGSYDITEPSTDLAKQWDGWGTALKPGWEPIILARKPISGTVAANVAQWGTGALNIDACRIETDERAGPRDQPERRTNYSDFLSSLKGGGTGSGATSDLGRWPANVLLDEWHERVMYLKYNIPSDAACVIREYFDGYGDMPAVRERLRDVSDQGEAGQSVVLQTSLLREVVECEPAGIKTPNDGSPSLGRFYCEDESLAEGERVERSEVSGVEGRQAHLSRLRDAGAVALTREGTASIRADGKSQQQSLYSRAQGCCGAEAWATSDAGGSGASSEREQTGQPLQEPRASRQRDTQAWTSSDSTRIASSPARERTIEVRTLEVLESDIPRGWLAYFEDTGEIVRCGAAQQLDDQSGALTSGANPERRHIHDGGNIFKGFKGQECEPHRGLDIGGASRFYYVAKPSRAERDYGCEGLPAKSGGELCEREEGSAGLNNPRAGAGRTSGGRNVHPTVKPVALMRWLVRLVTPIGGTVLDPFTGSGTTGMACRYELREFIGIEREPEYVAIAERRIAAVRPQQAELPLEE